MDSTDLRFSLVHQLDLVLCMARTNLDEITAGMDDGDQVGADQSDVDQKREAIERIEQLRDELRLHESSADNAVPADHARATFGVRQGG